MEMSVLSLFEGGYQPITALSAVTALKNAGHQPRFLDMYVEGEQCLEHLGEDALILIPIPLFDSLQAAIRTVGKLRERSRNQTVVLFGQHSTINARRLVGRHCDYAIVGEWEQPIVSLVDKMLGRGDGRLLGVMDPQLAKLNAPFPPHMPRNSIAQPDRGVAPPLEKYPQPQLARLLGGQRVVGGIETTRGCHHKCSYCSVYAAYDGKVLMTQLEAVVADVRSLVDQGMEHLTFIDADFFNAKKYALQVIERLHKEFPALTYDFTTRVDHILENRDPIRQMAAMNVRVITSALEFPTQRVLDEVYKEMTVPMMEEAVRFIADCGIQLNPTFITFNPWVGLGDFVEFHDFLARNRLESSVDPIQYETRLHLYKGSPLMKNASIQKLEMVEREFDYDWKHPDPRVDELFQSSVTPVTEQSGFKRCCLKC